MYSSRWLILSIVSLWIPISVNAQTLPAEIAIMTSPPLVPPPITRNHPAKVIVRMETVEKVMPMADGVDYMFWTFGGSVPGQFIRVRVNDEIEFHLSNHPSSKMPHNIEVSVYFPQAARSACLPIHDKTQCLDEQLNWQQA